MEEKKPRAEDQPGQRSGGMQGIDKAPGEEQPVSTEQFISQTQKGKNKVDGDPYRQEDQPLDQQDPD